MAADGIHAGDTDKTGRCLLLPLDSTVGERADAAFPGATMPSCIQDLT